MRLFERQNFEQAIIRAAHPRLATAADQERNPRAKDAKLLLGRGLQRVGRSLLKPRRLDELYRKGQRN